MHLDKICPSRRLAPFGRKPAYVWFLPYFPGEFGVPGERRF